MPRLDFVILTESYLQTTGQTLPSLSCGYLNPLTGTKIAKMRWTVYGSERVVLDVFRLSSRPSEV